MPSARASWRGGLHDVGEHARVVVAQLGHRVHVLLRDQQDVRGRLRVHVAERDDRAPTRARCRPGSHGRRCGRRGRSCPCRVPSLPASVASELRTAQARGERARASSVRSPRSSASRSQSLRSSRERSVGGHDVQRDVQVAAAPAVHVGHAAALDADDGARLGAGLELDALGAVEPLDLELGAERRPASSTRRAP